MQTRSIAASPSSHRKTAAAEESFEASGPAVSVGEASGRQGRRS